MVQKATLVGAMGGLLLAACGDDGSGGTGGSTDATGSTDSTMGGGSATGGTISGPSTDPADSTDADGGTDSTGEPADPCAALPGSSAMCLEDAGCMGVDAYDPHPDLACGVDGLPWRRCVTMGEPLASNYRSTYYREFEGEGMRFLVTGQPCTDPIPAVPVGWTECTGAPGEPEQCGCLCGADVCPWQQDVTALDACGLEEPCGALIDHEFGLGLGAYSQCVLEALRDRTPGRLVSRVVDPLFIDEIRVYAAGGDEVLMVHRHEGDFCGNPLHGTWSFAARCTLEPPAFFDACLQGSVDQQNACLFDNGASGFWFTDCREAEAICP